jgi:aminopeptidase N
MQRLVLLTLACLSFTAGASSAGKVPAIPIVRHDVSVVLDPQTHVLEGVDRITIDARGEVYSFILGDAFEVSRVRIDGKKVRAKNITRDVVPPEQPDTAAGETGEDNPYENRQVYRLPRVKEGRRMVEIEYKGVVYDTLAVPEGSRAGQPSETKGLIGEEGTYLSGRTGWYPDGLDVFAPFSVRVTTPPGIEAVTEGKRSSVHRDKDETVTQWDISYPTQGVTLIAGRFVVREREIEGVTLMAYFFDSEKDLITPYLEASGRYIELYNKLIGPYPFSKFAVVENFFPTGYGMPSYTLLGRRVIRLPFIIGTSLGHEVVHNWWGNSVYPDYAKGNWCEGLASYYADYRYKTQESDSAAAVYRREINVDYATYVNEGNDIALTEFRSRVDPATASVGYGKCTMVFYMLKNQVGEDRFYRAMRNFYRRYRFAEADWDDIEAVFEDAADTPLDWFFDQWVRRPGAPRLRIVKADLDETDKGYRLDIAIGNPDGYELPAVPVVIESAGQTRRIAAPVRGDVAAFDLRLDERPLRLSVDPDNEFFRRLDPAEIPSTIARALADEKAVVAMPTNIENPAKREAYTKVAETLSRGGRATVEDDTALRPADLANRTVFVLGSFDENSVYDLLPPPDNILLAGDGIEIDGDDLTEPGAAAFVAYANPLDPNRTVCAIAGNSAAAVEAAGPKVIWYGKYGFVTFLDGKRQKAGGFPPAHNPLAVEFAEPDSASAE